MQTNVIRIEPKNLVDRVPVGTTLELVKTRILKDNKKNALPKTQNIHILKKNIYIHVHPYESKSFIHKYKKSSHLHSM